MFSTVVCLCMLSITCLVSGQFTDQQKKDLVNLHNNYRRQVNPRASNMKTMSWDNQIANLAQTWVNQCQFGHGNPPNNLGWIGQNLYMGWDNTGKNAVDMWYKEKVDYNYNSNSCAPGKVCGHYTQVVWAKSERLGCGAKKCGNAFIIACNYYPGGNFNNEKPYLT